MDVSEIRSRFLNYFSSNEHEVISSSSLIPMNDNTLLFTNAGMVPFKDNFTGASKPKNRRAVSIQKCVRAGGKHNDLENVGFTARHHTFFEMMGNFSFGDYFKKEAIKMAWEFLTVELKIPKEKLYVTVHHSDEEAADLWFSEAGVSRDRIFFRGDKDNFWEMGEVGPCGPCSEIFYDHGEKYSDPEADTTDCILNDESRYVEIWNLVFMQYEKFKIDNKIEKRKLPRPSVDTGAGLERLCAVMQGEYNNFDTDVFSIIIKEVENISSNAYIENPKWMRVVADHARSSVMLLADGVLPSNEGRGYVLRRIVRRAIRHLDLLGVKDVAFWKLVKTVFQSFNGVYPENEKNKDFVEKYLKIEEESFRKTLNSGLKLLGSEINKLIKKNKKVLDGEKVFILYDTHGFPIDLTEMILREKGLGYDNAGFKEFMKRQKNRSKLASDFSASGPSLKEFYEIKEKYGETEFTGYEDLESKSMLIGDIPISNNRRAIIFDSSPFYGESGGQMGDVGVVKLGERKISIIDTKKPIDGIHAHIIESNEKFVVGNSYNLKVNKSNRELTMANHTATHLLQAALISVLGSHVKQAGSNVGANRLRFDFTHPEGLSKQELCEVENLVNAEINKSVDVIPQSMSRDNALAKGAMALFGEKYGDDVRVIDIPGFSIELCGGTHVKNTSDINLFKIISESSLSTGVRRIEACTKNGAYEYLMQKNGILEEIEALLSAKGETLIKKVSQMQKESFDRAKEIKALKEKIQSQNAQNSFSAVKHLKNGSPFLILNLDSNSDMRKMSDLFMDKYPEGVICLLQTKGDKCSVLLKTFRGNKLLHCSNILKEGLDVFKGRGGGKPEMAQGSFDLTNKDKFIDWFNAKVQ